MEQRQLAWLITMRSQVRVLVPQPRKESHLVWLFFLESVQVMSRGHFGIYGILVLEEKTVSGQNTILAKLNKLSPLWVLALFLAIAVITFYIGLTSPFIGDDFPQLVESTQAHSVTNIPKFFSESTFSDGDNTNKLTGTGYRPLMMVAYSMLYALFGPHPVAFHLFLMLLSVASAFLLFLILRYFLPQAFSLILALIFLIHPINSQSVFSIPVTQDTLFMVFGLLGFWTLLRFQDKSRWYLLLTTLCFLLSIFSKETGVLFILISVVYTLITNRKKSYILIGLMALVFALYIPLKIHAVGLSYNAHNAPIEEFNIWHRLLNDPQLIMFYVTRFIFPLHLAQAYYWVQKDITLMHFFLPLLLDILLATGLIYLGIRTHQKDKKLGMVYTFFAIWFISGLVLDMQIIALDMTASETWFYFPMIGALGMIGAAWTALVSRKYWPASGYIALSFVVLLAGRTFIRGFDWQSQTKLAYKNVVVSKEDYVSYGLIANDFLRKGNYREAKIFAANSVKTYPFGSNYNTLAAAELYSGEYAAARNDYMQAIKYGGDRQYVYENLALVYTQYDDPTNARQFYTIAVAKYPQNGEIWFCVAVFANSHGYSSTAKAAITNAYKLGGADENAYTKIMNGQSYTISLSQVK